MSDSARAKEEKRICRSPTPGKGPTRIDRWKYEVLKRAILEVVPEDGEGILFKDLPSRVARAVREDDRARLGSIGWYTTTVKLDLEVKGVIKRVAGVRPQRLLRSR